MKAKRYSDLVTSRSKFVRYPNSQLEGLWTGCFKKSAATNMMQDRGTLIIPWENSSL